MKRFFYFLSIIGAHLLVLISCEKTPVPEYRDELLSQVSGKYQLVEFQSSANGAALRITGIYTPPQKTLLIIKDVFTPDYQLFKRRGQESFGRQDVVYSLLILLIIKEFILRIKIFKLQSRSMNLRKSARSKWIAYTLSF